MSASPRILPPERDGTAPPTDLAARRAAIAAALQAGYWATDPPPSELVVAGRRVLAFDPPGIALATVVHVHGGAFRLGCPDQMGPFARALADRCSIRMLCPTYRLAPEHPFPAGLRDALDVYDYVVAQAGAPVILSGDSAGGGIAASLTALAADRGNPPAALVLLSPWLDLRLGAASYRTNADRDPVFSHDAAQEAASLYLQGHPAADPSASPLTADLKGFPPTLIVTGTGEVLVDDSRAFDESLRNSGVRSTLRLIDGMEHVAATRSGELTGSVEALHAIDAFVRSIATS